MATWPSGWQSEAIAALEPYVGSDHVVEIWVGDAEQSISGTLLEGNVLVGDDDRVMVLYDRSGRTDVYPWALLPGPVLRMTARVPGRKRQVIFAHPTWNASG